MTNSYKVQDDMYQILNEHGEVDKARLAQLNLTNQTLVSMYQWMLKGRLLDERLVRLQRQGRLGTYGQIAGQEAAQVGSAMVIDAKDWLATSYREVAVSLVRGRKIEQMLMYHKGYFSANQPPRTLPIQIIIAAQILHAVGIAWAEKLKGRSPNATVCYFGDGATSEGDFHEGMNFASVYKLPVVFFCQNNQWAISVPLNKQMASETIAQKAIAYGMKGVRVDGNDVLACYQVTQEAIQRAKNGEGPTLIEAVTYRQGAHTTADDPTRYRDQAEVECWKQKDPLTRYSRFLKQRHLLSDEQIVSMREEITQEIENAIVAFEQLHPAKAYEMFDYVYEQPHTDLLLQKEELKNRLTNGGTK